METNHKTELEKVSKTFETRFINTELLRAVGELPIDAEGDKLKNQQEIVIAMAKQKIEFRMENDQTVGYREGKLISDSKLDPIPVKDVIAAIGARPLYGNRSGKQGKTHWMAFIKVEGNNG